MESIHYRRNWRSRGNCSNFKPEYHDGTSQANIEVGLEFLNSTELSQFDVVVEVTSF